MNKVLKLQQIKNNEEKGYHAHSVYSSKGAGCI